MSRLTITHDLPAGIYLLDDGGDADITLDCVIATPPIVTPPPVEPPVEPPPVTPPPVTPPVDPPPTPPPTPPPSNPPPVPPATTTGVGIRNEVVALGMAVFYQDYSTPPADLTLASVLWDFGDGTTAADAGGQHLYAQAGGYHVTENVTYSDGSTASSTTPVTIALVPSVSPDGLSVLYHMDVNDFVAFVAWAFGDGTNAKGGDGSGTGANGRHAYAQAGTYTVTGSVTYVDSINRIDPFGPVTVTVA